MASEGPTGFMDLDYEAELLLDRMGARIEEKKEEYGPEANWQDGDPWYHFRAAIRNVCDAEELAEYGDRENARRQAADAVNHLLMAMANVEEESGGEDGG